MSASGHSRHGLRGQHAGTKTPSTSQERAWGLVWGGISMGGGRGSAHNPKDDKGTRRRPPRHGHRGKHAEAATPYCTPGKSLGLVGKKEGSSHTPSPTKVHASGYSSPRRRSACRGRHALLHARKELGLSMGEKGKAPTTTRTTWMPALGHSRHGLRGQHAGTKTPSTSQERPWGW